MSATPAFFMAELGDPGLDSRSICFLTGDVFTLAATSVFASLSRVTESATDLRIFFSSIALHSLAPVR